MRKAFYLKANPKITRTRVKTGVGDYKVEVFKESMENWKWPLDLVEDLNQIEKWSYGRQLRLSREINGFFFSTYRRLSDRLHLKEKQAIDDYDLTILGRKLFALFARAKSKLKLNPSLTQKRPILTRCIFQYEQERSGKSKWVIYDASWYPTEQKNRKWKIFSCESVVRAAAWLVNNGLYDFHRSVIEMTPNSSDTTVGDIQHLLKHLQAFFQPAFYLLSNGGRVEQEAAIERIMVIIAMEEVSKRKRPAVVDIAFKNTWGEMFTENYGYYDGLLIVKKYLHDLERHYPKDIASRIKLHWPESAQEMEIANDLYFQLFHDLGLEYPFHEAHFPFSYV
jgi:adenylate cyclase